MERLMNIQKFSKRTGIPKSTLRFYETKGLLIPAKRGINDYRLYDEQQINKAKWINSLRIADVPIKEIQHFMEAGSQARLSMIDNWIYQLEKKKEMISISIQYLKSHSNPPSVYLMEKPQQKVIWFHTEGKKGEFGKEIMEKTKMLEKMEIPFSDGYIKYLSGMDRVKVKLGFGIPKNTSNVLLSNDHFEIETMPSMVCLGLPFNDSFTNILEGYHQLMSYASEHQWIPTGGIFEWYRDQRFNEADLLLPVMKMKEDDE